MGFVEMSPFKFQLKQLQGTVNTIQLDVHKNKIHMQHGYQNYF